MRARRMERLLALCNKAEIGRRLGVSRSVVGDWEASDDPPPKRLEQVEALLRDALQQKEAAPDWERLEATVYAIADKLDVSQLEVEAKLRADAVVEEHTEPGDGDDLPGSTSSGPSGPSHKRARRGL